MGRKGKWGAAFFRFGLVPGVFLFLLLRLICLVCLSGIIEDSIIRDPRELFLLGQEALQTTLPVLRSCWKKLLIADLENSMMLNRCFLHFPFEK